MKFIEWFTGAVNQQCIVLKPVTLLLLLLESSSRGGGAQDPKRRCGVGEGKEETAMI